MPSSTPLSLLLGAGVLLSASPVAAQRRLSRPIGGYIPGSAPAIVSTVLFLCLGLLCCVHLVRHGRAGMLPLIVGLFAFAAGLAARVANHFEPFIISPFVAQQVILLACPCFFLAQSYLTLDRLQEHLRVKKCLLLPARWVIGLFCTFDVVVFLLCCAGGGTQASENRTTAQLGQKLSTIGLAIQLASFSLFMCLLAVFGFRVRQRYPEKWSYVRHEPVGRSLLGMFSRRKIDDWKVVYFAQWLIAVGILIRSIYRIVEYADGYTGYLWLHEAFFYFLDVLVLFLAMSVYVVVWPPRFLPATSAVRGEFQAAELAEKDRRRWFGKKERVGSDV